MSSPRYSSTYDINNHSIMYVSGIVHNRSSFEKSVEKKKKSDALAEEQDGGQDKRNSPQEAAHQEYLLHQETGDENGRRSVDEYYNTDDVPEDEVQEDEEEKKKQFLEARKMHYKISKNILYVIQYLLKSTTFSFAYMYISKQKKHVSEGRTN